MAESVEQLRNTYPLGARVRLTDESVGTVRYVGEVEGHKAAWLGLEWDEAHRGKHDGRVNAVQYFTTSHPSAGSMVRPGRVAPRVSLRHAIEHKYILTVNQVLDERLLAETQRKLHASIFEIVGMDKVRAKQSHWDGLRVVSVDGLNVYMAGILTQLTQLTELHLTGSLLDNWGPVADILRQAPTIELLNLSQNRLRPPTDEQIVAWRPHFDRLQAINLRCCALSDWAAVLHVARLWPNVRKVSVQENGLVELSPAPQGECFGRLETLDLSENGIVDFGELINLGRLQTLRSLNVAENRLNGMRLPDCEADEFSDLFEGLCEINLKENPIEDDCAAFNELDKLRGLQTLLYTNEGRCGFEAMFSNAVARMSRLRVLNGMALVAADRRGAEYDLWKAQGVAWMQMAVGEAEAQREWGRRFRSYHRLVDKYGSPADVCIAAPKISNLITIHMQTDHGDGRGLQQLSKRVSRKMSVQALRGVALKLLASAATVGTTLPKLSYLDRSRGDLKIGMENESKSLDYYSLQDGDAVIVEW